MEAKPNNETLSRHLSPAMSQAEDVAVAEKHSYSQIIKSSVLIGGSQVVNVAIRIVRTKAMAVLLGPT